ncbi:MAG: hypothetical protein HY736_04555 [Verrucomicrobia bacterium]|nr:hypothetical protein [Verrucomicrobiota bacterium]
MTTPLLPSIPFANGTAPAEAKASAPSVGSARRIESDTGERAELLAIVLRAQSGDLNAQSELVRRYTARVSGFVRPIISQPSAVEDVAQMVFIKMVRRLGLLRDPMTFESWLFTLARNAALDYIRRAAAKIMMSTQSLVPHLLAFSVRALVAQTASPFRELLDTTPRR